MLLIALPRSYLLQEDEQDASLSQMQLHLMFSRPGFQKGAEMINRCFVKRNLGQLTLKRITKHRRCFGLVIASLAILLDSALTTATTTNQLIEKAHKLSQSGNIDSAIVIIQEVLNEKPNDAIAWASLGIFKGMKAASATDYSQAGRLSFEAFSHLDKAVDLDPSAVKPRLWRGIMGVKVPEFMGRLDQAISDLELVVKAFEENPNKESQEAATQALDLLIEAYGKKGQPEEQLRCAKKLIAIAQDPEIKARAATLVEQSEPKISVQKPQSKDAPSAPQALLERSMKLLDDGDLEGAEKMLKEVISIDERNVTAYKLLAKAIMLQMESGVYDQRIHDDTNWAANRAFEIIKVLDDAISISPDDLELRLMRGMMGVELPFFVNKLDQGIEDLEIVIASDAPQEVKSQAEFYLGHGYQKKAMKYWLNLIRKYPDSRAAELALEAISPPVKKLDLSKVKRPSLIIDFVIAFKDELSPQVALWVEKENGDYVKTIYVSGFSGYVKESQIVLPKWAQRSNFVDADAVTSASIDIGEHCYVWDLIDINGRRIANGKYIVNLEVNFWPSGKYEHLKAPVSIGKQDQSMLIKDNKLVPYFEIKYLR